MEFLNIYHLLANYKINFTILDLKRRGFEFNFRMGCCLGKQKDKLDESSSWDVKASRSCTDVFCLVLFILYVGAMGALSVYGVYTGGAERLLYGMDSFGNICGMKNEKEEGKHIYNGQG